MFIRNLSVNVKEVVGYVNMEFRGDIVIGDIIWELLEYS